MVLSRVDGLPQRRLVGLSVIAMGGSFLVYRGSRGERVTGVTGLRWFLARAWRLRLRSVTPVTPNSDLRE
ncbi:hypothetical protein JOF36_000741 [Pseudonocardia parietis]|uniref:Uncharacterized protein n=1 Tax=Pseudonocardia parietis TaxID=570936 RepID=A0ABS4VM88_9PSEU|nr:hypothetical protein [Pseudonocardia parietis]